MFYLGVFPCLHVVVRTHTQLHTHTHTQREAALADRRTNTPQLRQRDDMLRRLQLKQRERDTQRETDAETNRRGNTPRDSSLNGEKRKYAAERLQLRLLLKQREREQERVVERK